jgi:hypothetical protein
VRAKEFTLPETLSCANYFRPGDCPLLTVEEARELDRQNSAPAGMTTLEFELATRTPGAPAPEVPMGKVAWGLMRP